MSRVYNNDRQVMVDVIMYYLEWLDVFVVMCLHLNQYYFKTIIVFEKK